MPSREYICWVNMKQRCYNEKNPEYVNYGGRGIIVCDRWINSFKTFLSDIGRIPDGLSLDRIDNNGNYEPSNCRLTTMSVQGFNQRVSVKSKTGISGVTWCKQTNRWKSSICVNRKQITLGRFKDFFEACCVRKTAENIYFKQEGR